MVAYKSIHKESLDCSTLNKLQSAVTVHVSQMDISSLWIVYSVQESL